MIIKYILPVVLSLCISPCFSQKVLVLSNITAESKDGNIYLQYRMFDSVIVYHKNGHGEFVIPVDKDQIYIYGRNEGIENMFSDIKSSYAPPSYSISHIQSFTGDTIFLSGLSFAEYFNQRTLTAESSGTKKGGTGSYTKPINISPDEKRAFPDSLLYPDIRINGKKAGGRLSLSRTTGTSSSTTFVNGITTKYTYETLLFTFDIDLSKRIK